MDNSISISVRQLAATPNQVKWSVSIGAASYVVTTYPNGNSLFVENDRGRQVNLGPARLSAIRSAIAQAGGGEDGAGE